MNEKSVADMSRAKSLKGLFRMVTPYLAMKSIPLLAINHTYKEIGLFPKDIVSGGTGIMYSADNVWIVGRRQQKQGTEIKGYDFIINFCIFKTNCIFVNFIVYVYFRNISYRFRCIASH